MDTLQAEPETKTEQSPKQNLLRAAQERGAVLSRDRLNTLTELVIDSNGLDDVFQEGNLTVIYQEDDVPGLGEKAADMHFGPSEKRKSEVMHNASKLSPR